MNTHEQRKVKRSRCGVPVQGQDGSGFSGSYSVDVSRGGIGLLLPARLPLKHRIAVELDMGLDYDPVLMLGEVRWVRPAREPQQYRVGMKFIKVLTPGSRTRLEQYLGAPS